MAVDQAGHQRAAAAIDHLGAFGLDRLVRALADAVALDQDLEPVLKLAQLGLEHLEVPEQQLRHDEGPPRSRHRTTGRGRGKAINLLSPLAGRGRLGRSPSG